MREGSLSFYVSCFELADITSVNFLDTLLFRNNVRKI